MLKVDYTVFIQIANFLFLVFVLNILLYRPIRDMLRRRREQVESFQSSRDDLMAKSGQNEKALDENVVGARKEGFRTKESFKLEALDAEKGMLREASASAADTIAKAKEEIEYNMANVRQSLKEELSRFSKEMAERVLGRSI